MEKKILCVDDETVILQVLGHLLTSSGYSPVCSSDGEEALQIMKRDHVRVFITDLRMPAMDGVELCRRVKQHDPAARVYALSAYTDAYSPDELREAGFDGYLSKPFKVDELLDTCRKAFADLEQPDDSPPAP